MKAHPGVWLLAASLMAPYPLLSLWRLATDAPGIRLGPNPAVRPRADGLRLRIETPTAEERRVTFRIVFRNGGSRPVLLTEHWSALRLEAKDSPAYPFAEQVCKMTVDIPEDWVVVPVGGEVTFTTTESLSPEADGTYTLVATVTANVPPPSHYDLGEEIRKKAERILKSEAATLLPDDLISENVVRMDP